MPMGRGSTAGILRAGAGSVLAVFELHSPEGAFARIEGYLRDAGFFRGAAAGLVADLYLGYGLSAAFRRKTEPSPPEPCPLPLAACRISRPDERPSEEGPFRIGGWQRTWDSLDYASAIAVVRQAIAEGSVYQVNLVQHLAAPFDGDPAALATALLPLRPRHIKPLQGDGWTIVSGSPELFLARRGNRVWTAPIKGTRPLEEDDLGESEKDAAEHVMIVDLERNDLSRVCEPGTVRWPGLMTEQELAGVKHLVTRVEGRLRDGVGLAELLEATFPGGSVTGAPKISAIDYIAAIEPVGRGASMGALGRVWPNGDLDLALTIRTFAVAEGRIHLWVGGGVVWDSDADEEIEESWVKARPLLAAVGAPIDAPVAT